MESESGLFPAAAEWFGPPDEGDVEEDIVWLFVGSAGRVAADCWLRRTGRPSAQS
ncbi:hypothetical protein C884_01514 [Kocuria palustris PEL]|uniref:Uncharacterized protein n=1 Tax=Kocuria palustris PEL TaxID=1236550 RepID=M2WAX3_9MICC|nr:hypothetical protein C884_01514 [Kocuria palustris PEL]